MKQLHPAQLLVTTLHTGKRATLNRSSRSAHHLSDFSSLAHHRGAYKGSKRECTAPAAQLGSKSLSCSSDIGTLVCRIPAVNLHADTKVALKTLVFVVHSDCHSTDGAVLDTGTLACRVATGVGLA